ncbi:MAG: radical SAM protein [Bacteroidales bacterium]|nr:radical SAM protein [Bacteroidales bacterium]
MKLRIESNGYHFYDRITGLHYLIDEIKPDCEQTYGPRTVSIAITNDCNANCSFCHIPKGKLYLDKDFVTEFCKTLDKIGTFDIAIGGGEPLLHPELVEICKTVWNETKLGISITTNGQLLTEDFIEEIKDSVSFIRVSLDSIDETCYKTIRNFDLDSVLNNISLLNKKIPFGINMIVNSATINGLDDMLEFAKNFGAEELLILPLFTNGKFDLTNSQWNVIEEWIIKNFESFPIRILEQARKKIKIPLLFTDDDYYKDYIYLSPDKQIRKNSYIKRGIKLNHKMIERQLLDFKNNGL